MTKTQDTQRTAKPPEPPESQVSQESRESPESQELQESRESQILLESQELLESQKIGGRSDEANREHRLIVAVKGIIRDGNRVLLIRRAPDDLVEPGTWEFVGGKIDFPEQPEAALIREIREEAGLEVSVGRLLYATTFVVQETRHVLILSYLCDARTTDVRLSDEHTAHLWADPAQLEEMLHPPILKDLEREGVRDLIFSE